MKWAAYDDVSIYAIGDTSVEAVKRAEILTKTPGGAFCAGPIDDDLAAYIECYGWNRDRDAFEIDERNYLVRCWPGGLH
jgi:hypothetical protein